MIQEEQTEGNLIKFSSTMLGFFPSLWEGLGEGA
jgi:hypothetical protein